MIDHVDKPPISVTPAPPNVHAPMPGPTHLVLKQQVPPRLCATLRAGEPGYLQPGECPQLERIVRRVIGMAEQRYGRIGATLTELKILRYGVGDYMRPHTDNAYEGAVFPGQDEPVGCVPWALQLYLSEPGSEYEGGALAVGEERLQPPKGSAVVLRGDVLHQVEPVTSGVRTVVKALVSVPTDVSWLWLNGTWVT